MSEELPLLVQHLRGWYAMTVLALGRRSGALDALGEGAASAEELAERTGLDRRNVDVWLRALRAAGHVDHADGRFTLAPGTTALLGPDFPVDLGKVLDVVHAAMAEPLQEVAIAMRAGGGIVPERFAALGEAAAGANSRLYRMALVDEWIAGAPGVVERLRAGGRVAEIACGNGDAAAIVAEAFPASTVVGYDPGAPADAHPDVANLTVVAATDHELPGDGSLDLVTCLDAFHHLGDPDAVARRVHASLRPGGVFLVAETALSGDVDADAEDPFALIAHSAGLVYCLQENLANGGSGQIPSIGLGWVEDALAGAGFASVSAQDSETGFRVYSAVR